ncbi:MAG: OmpH family outer membrane protein [Saprospiraceae bacterium]|nr:OmpH family outer membrane protein [Saprospiraceae bacterium]HMW38450.1 OmpH family outer membrane protein [Saprospiraceae bacterium]HMX87580.1 OmpH family outer membrane protein [Saprospiraceae bacterium]HMZ40913.1 OmpH family outer membrane protein [Saprospiraceae bacterium]HNA64160.1 OmpH family outer membrane protein [Saprospiraceae bacterium]
MKNLNWILHAISIAGLVFLFWQNQSLKKNHAPGVNALPAASIGSSNGMKPIAYFVSDSLLSKLEFFKKSEDEFKAKRERMAGELKARENSFQKEIQQLQSNAPNLTRNEMESAQKRLAKMEQELMEKKEKMEQQFAEETAEFNEKLHQKVVAYLQEVNQDSRYSYVFSVAREGNIFYADSSYNITEEMVRALNEKYSK